MFTRTGPHVPPSDVTGLFELTACLSVGRWAVCDSAERIATICLSHLLTWLVRMAADHVLLEVRKTKFQGGRVGGGRGGGWMRFMHQAAHAVSM